MVNGEPISLSEFHSNTDLKQTAQVMSPQGPTETRVIGSFGLQSMQELVDQRVLMQMAKEQNVLPTEAEIDQEIKLQTDLRHDYISALQDQGLPMEAIRRQIAVGLARQHLIMKGVEVSKSEVEDFIRKNPTRFSEPARATLYFILAKTAKRKSEVDKALASGKPFNQVAGELSEDPNAKTTSGLYGTSVIGQMPPRLQEVIAKTEAKHATDWLVDPTGSLKFFVEAKAAGKQLPVSDSKKEMVRRLLAMQKGETKNNFTKMFYDKLKASKVDVQVPYLQEPWKKTWDQLSEPAGAMGGK